jgi:hypothetical protein
MGATLLRMTQVHQCCNAARTTLICLRSRISRSCSFIGPGASGAHARHAGDERIQISGGIGLEIGAILQQRPAYALEP